MPYANTFYETHHSDKYSQNGEDGVISAILDKFHISSLNSEWVCEFGAWDGKHLSNTFALVEKGCRAVLIEGDREKFSKLLETSYSYPNIIPILAMLGENNSLETVLSRTLIPKDFLLLSIDIDSFDYQVWAAFSKYRPRIVIIEINSSVSPSIENWIHDGHRFSGTSFTPMLRLGQRMGYQLLCHTGNMVFIRNEDANLFDIPSDPTSCFRNNWL